MKKFIKDFTLDQVDELYDYEIYQLLDKKKFQEEWEVKKYFQNITQAQQKLQKKFSNLPVYGNQPNKQLYENQPQLRAQFDKLSKRVCGYYCCNVVKTIDMENEQQEDNEKDQIDESVEIPPVKRQRIQQRREPYILNNTKILLLTSRDQTRENRKRRETDIDPDELYKQRCKEAFEFCGFD